MLRIAALTALPSLVHGFSTSALGTMRQPPVEPSPRTPNRRAFASMLGLDPLRLTAAGTVHGAHIARVDTAIERVCATDGLVTDRGGLPLLVPSADCYPVLVFDPARRALGLAHAGWRGTAAGIAVNLVAALRREYGSRPHDLVAGLGPGICGGCYEVSKEVANRFDPHFTRSSGRPGRFLLDLAAALGAQLEAAGIVAARVHAHGACTFETVDLASHRRSPDGASCACIAAIS